MDSSCREGIGSPETGACFQEAAAFFLYFSIPIQQNFIQMLMGNMSTSNVLTDLVHTELVFLSTKASLD